MAEQTGIEWCDATFNPWWGCEKVSPGCAHCYADTLAHRRAPGQELWGADHEFRFFGDKHWAEPLKWARYASQELLPDRTENRDGHRPRIFCASMADVFEEHPQLGDGPDRHQTESVSWPQGPRTRLFNLIAATPQLDWLLLTKRPEFARSFLVDYFNDPVEVDPDVFENIWVGVSIENARHTWRADVLREIPAAVRFISAEPLLGSLFASATKAKRRWEREASAEVMRIFTDDGMAPDDASSLVHRVEVNGPNRTTRPLDLTGIDWVIIGGESGPGAREMRLEWAVELVDACGPGPNSQATARSGTVPFVKQLGAVAGRTLGAGAKGQHVDAFPDMLRRREFPTPKLTRSEAA